MAVTRLREIDAVHLLYGSVKPGPGGSVSRVLTSLELLDRLARLRTLTLSAERLAAIRQVRYPDSRCASAEQCRCELAAAERLYKQHGLSVIDTTRMSVEEIAVRLRYSF